MISVASEQQLLNRAGTGDREAIADLVRHYEPLIRARFRASFEQQQSMFDSSDFFATMLRRVDEIASCGGVDGLSMDIKRTLHRIMLDAISDYARTLSHEHEAADRPLVQVTTQRIRDDDASVVAAVNHLDVTDRLIVRLRLNGLKHRAIAGALGLQTPAVRMRWIRLREELRSTLS